MNATNTTAQQIAHAFALANDAYAKRNPGIDLAGKMQNDIAAGLTVFASFSDGQFAALAKLGVNWESVAQGIAGASNVKVARRLPQFVAFAITGDGNYLKGSAQTGLIEFCALGIGAKTKDALRFASTGKGDENTSDVIDVSRARAIQKAFGRVSSSSRDTQASVSFSRGGMLEILGIVTPWAKGDAMPGMVDCKFSRALSALISSATDSTIELWAAQAKQKKGSAKGAK